MDAAVASICERQRVDPTEHTSTDVEIYVDRALAEFFAYMWQDLVPCRLAVNPERLPTPDPCLYWKNRHSHKMWEYFILMIWGRDTSLSCTGLGVPGRARLCPILSRHAMFKLRILSMPHTSMICIIALDLRSSTCQGSQKYFMLTPARRRLSARTSSTSLFLKE